MKTAALLLALIVAPASFAGANLIVNGDFEASPTFPDQPTGTWSPYLDSEIGGWTVTHTFATGNEYPPMLEVWDHLYGLLAYSGDQCVELDSSDPTMISQEVPTTAGNIYELSYAWRPRPGVAVNQMKVWVDGVEIAYHSASGSNSFWTPETYVFMATGDSTMIAIAEVGPDDQLGMLLDAVSLTLVAVAVDVDIKPGSFPNSINLGAQGRLPVAIFGSADLDVLEIDPETLELGGVKVMTRGSARAPQLACSYEDVDGDGYMDLVAFFSVQELVDAGALTETTTELPLTGMLYDGISILGADSVRPVPPM